MANTTNTRNTCRECGYMDHGVCTRSGLKPGAHQYACNLFKTRDEIKAEREERNRERMKEEQRLNFILTALYISTTASQQLLEYFDAQFADRKAEAKWRFECKRAANEIGKLAQRIRDIYQHSFMQDQNQVMTKHGTAPYDVEAYDSHEDDARRWNLCLFHHMDGCWQDEGMEQMVLNFYEELPHLGIFDQRDYRHFTTKR